MSCCVSGQPVCGRLGRLTASLVSMHPSDRGPTVWLDGVTDTKSWFCEDFPVSTLTGTISNFCLIQRGFRTLLQRKRRNRVETQPNLNQQTPRGCSSQLASLTKLLFFSREQLSACVIPSMRRLVMTLFLWTKHATQALSSHKQQTASPARSPWWEGLRSDWI